MRPISGKWAIPVPAAPVPKSSTTTAPAFPAGRPARPTRAATVMSKSGTWCSCNTTATRPASSRPCPSPRAIRHGHRLGARETFFYKLVGPLCQQMSDAYPELNSARSQIERVLRQEEDRFNETLEQGLKILEDDVAALKGDTISGATVFKLYDTYGFPVDLTRDVALERNLKIDMAGFEREMEAQRERARAASSFKSAEIGAVTVDQPTQFTGYERLSDGGKILQITRGTDLALTDSLCLGEQGNIVLDRTP